MNRKLVLIGARHDAGSRFFVRENLGPRRRRRWRVPRRRWWRVPRWRFGGGGFRGSYGGGGGGYRGGYGGGGYGGYRGGYGGASSFSRTPSFSSYGRARRLRVGLWNARNGLGNVRGSG